MTVPPPVRRRGTAALLALGLSLAACSGDDDGGVTITSDSEGIVDVDGEPVDRDD